MRKLSTLKEYENLLRQLREFPDKNRRLQILRKLCRTDLFFLIWYGFQRKDIAHPWLLARCREVEENPDGYLDLWAREHYKSTIITYAKTIQDILASHGDDPLPEWKGMEPTFGIFSHTRSIAKGFLRQHKREFESNELLKILYPDIIWDNPHRDAPKWSEDDGLIMKRKGNPKESTIEAWGLVDGQPTSKHFSVMIYDDVVTLESVRSPDMMRKTLESWEMSINLGGKNVRRRHVGTRYHFNDAYRDLIRRDAAIVRQYPGTIDGTPDGEPVLISVESMAEKRRLLGPYTFATQILMNPLMDEIQGLRKEWIRYHNGSDGTGMNKYLIIDPASEKKKTSDYTAIFVIGLGEDQNYYVLDMLRDRLNLKERGDAVFYLHRKWRPFSTGYEIYGLQADIEYIRERQEHENYRFEIVELGGQMPKNDRIRRLIPSLSEGKWYYPQSLFRTDYQGKVQDLIDVYLNEEYLAFPVPVHDDMLDCQSRIKDPELNVLFPRLQTDDKYELPRRKRSVSAWGR